jgi:hypothetical protein
MTPKKSKSKKSFKKLSDKTLERMDEKDRKILEILNFYKNDYDFMEIEDEQNSYIINSMSNNDETIGPDLTYQPYQNNQNISDVHISEDSIEEMKKIYNTNNKLIEFFCTSNYDLDTTKNIIISYIDNDIIPFSDNIKGYNSEMEKFVSDWKDCLNLNNFFDNIVTQLGSILNNNVK